jgi:hypothetical protein
LIEVVGSCKVVARVGLECAVCWGGAGGEGLCVKLGLGIIADETACLVLWCRSALIKFNRLDFEKSLTPSVWAGPSRGTRALNSPLPPPGAALASASVLRFDMMMDLSP